MRKNLDMTIMVKQSKNELKYMDVQGLIMYDNPVTGELVVIETTVQVEQKTGKMV